MIFLFNLRTRGGGLILVTFVYVLNGWSHRYIAHAIGKQHKGTIHKTIKEAAHKYYQKLLTSTLTAYTKQVLSRTYLIGSLEQKNNFFINQKARSTLGFFSLSRTNQTTKIIIFDDVDCVTVCFCSYIKYTCLPCGNLYQLFTVYS